MVFKVVRLKKNSDNGFKLFAGAAVLLLLVAAAWFYGSAPREKGVQRVDWGMGAAPVSSDSGEPSGIELTVYNSPSYQAPVYQPWMNYRYGGLSTGLALVKEKRTATLAQGLNALGVQGVSEMIDATSIHFKDSTDSGASVLEQNYDYDLVDQQKLLEKYLDQQITVYAGNKSFAGKLLSYSGGIILDTGSGIVSLGSYDNIAFPSLPGGLVTKPTINWLLGATKAGEHSFEVSYLTAGLNWHAEYVAVASAGDDKLDLQGWVSVENNAGVTFKDATLKLVAGDVHLVSSATQAYPAAKSMVETAGSYDNRQFAQESLFEYHLYTLDRPTTIAASQVKQVSLLSAEGVPVVKELVFQPSQSTQVQVKLSFENDEASGLGMPLPAGKVRVYKPDSTGQLQFLGEDSISHTPKDEAVRLFIGNAFDVLAERTQSNYDQLGQCSSQASYNVTVRNHKDSAVAVKFVDDSLYGDWEVTQESVPHSKLDSGTASWLVNAPANGEAYLTYTVRTRWC